MDLNYTNTDWEDVGVLKDYVFDLAFGSDENSFELTVSTGNHCCIEGCLVYIDGTEYGGIIDGIKVTTKEESLTYAGRTWHGILASKILQPAIGDDYLVVSGEANSVIAAVIENIGLSELFTVSTEDSGLMISDYSFDRYIDAYKGIKKMLKSISGKLIFTFKSDKVILSANPIADYSQDEQFDDNHVEMEISRVSNTANHLICLGKGELSERQVVHLYLDKNDEITESQTFFGLEEIMDIYDYSNAESLEELKKGGKEKLSEYISKKNSVKLDFSNEEKIYDIGDIVGATETITKVSVAQQINKKIVTINKGIVNIEYKVG